ncbi:adhesion G protein-coupled receptor F5-like [Xyrauchen texanus]|uniref:adhesion G protein-coupled receptor F5-like n=1 Tax=Xyrauchen texanus TaxID=154827 RepID=UPI002241B2DE|nr:adhesion G protein-coupled receptor F5-like [Xyrauchen texanus]
MFWILLKNCINPKVPAVITMLMRLIEDFDITLTNPSAEKYQKYAKIIESAIDKSYFLTVPTYIKDSAKVTRFRAGSTIAEFTINSTNDILDLGTANTEITKILNDSGIPLNRDSFSQSVQTTLSSTTGKIYPLQSMVLNCVPPDSAQGEIIWTMNKDVIAINSTKYTITNDRKTLIVKSASQSDSGRYSCTTQKNSMPYIQWQHIAIDSLPNINVGEKERTFSCENMPVQLRCCIDVAYKIEWVLDGTVQTPSIESGCITLDHKIQTEDCSDKIFTCRLKDLPDLSIYSYFSKSVTVKTSTEKFNCKNESLGFGLYGATVNGPCESGNDGIITYTCELPGIWTPTRNCVPQKIKELEQKAKFLVVDDIPVFLADLSNATEQNINQITQSTVTVQTIVDMLSKIADISQNITISQPVMENFLKTVDILLSNDTKDTWQTLANGNTTENTSIELLRAIETISENLSNDTFNISKNSIQLNRNTIKGSFNELSQLPNSTTHIEIPAVLEPTLITIIFFTNLDNILPTRNTTNNDSTQSNVNRINGDVVVIKVNQTINNISFTFDITDETLGNPQCVFWNFILDGWDSTGCEVRPLNESGKVKCECNHTTSFSILMSPFSVMPDKDLDKYLSYITYIGVAISMASLILCLIIEIIVWKSTTRNDTSYMRHVSIVNIAVSLLIADICFIIGAAVAEQEQPTSVGRCSPAVFFMHFFYLALFFWMLISALLLFYRTVMVLSQMSRANMMAIAFIVGYGAPLLIAVITVASTAGPKEYITKTNACWLNWFESKALLAFVVPALTIVAINLLVLIVVLYKMLRRGVGVATQPDEKHALVVIARCVAILTPIFGLTWGFGIGTMVSSDFGIHVVFAILNSLQGFFILVFGTLLDSKIREALAGKLSLSNLSSNRTRSTSAGPSSSGLGFFNRIRRRYVYNISDASASSSEATSSNNYSASDTFMSA